MCACRPGDGIPAGQEHFGGACRGGDSREGTTFVAAEASDADPGRGLLLSEGPVDGGLEGTSMHVEHPTCAQRGYPRGSELTECLRQIAFLKPDEQLEEMKWGRYKCFPVEIEIEEKKEAARAAIEWEDRKKMIWTDGSRLDDGSVGAACVWWKEEGPAPPRWRAQNGRIHTPMRPVEGGRGIYSTWKVPQQLEVLSCIHRFHKRQKVPIFPQKTVPEHHRNNFALFLLVLCTQFYFSDGFRIPSLGVHHLTSPRSIHCSK